VHCRESPPASVAVHKMHGDSSSLSLGAQGAHPSCCSDCFRDSRNEQSSRTPVQHDKGQDPQRPVGGGITDWHTSMQSTEAPDPILIVATTPTTQRRHATRPPERRCRYPLMPSEIASAGGATDARVWGRMAGTDGGPSLQRVSLARGPAYRRHGFHYEPSDRSL
jgi:hypothetical protein